MFYVYSPGGQLFAGTLEQLRKAQALSPVTKTRAPERTAVGQDAPASGSSLSHATLHRHEIRAYEASTRQPLTRVSEVMRRPAHVISATATVKEAWQTLNEHGIGQAPVVDANNRLVGMATRAEMLPMQLLTSTLVANYNWRTLLMQPVSQVMWTPVPSTHVDTDLRRVASLLLETKLPGLPVTDLMGQVLGFVSRTDLLRAIATDPPLDLWS